MSFTQPSIQDWILSVIPITLKAPTKEILDLFLKNNNTMLYGGTLREYLIKSKILNDLDFMVEKSIDIDAIKLILDSYKIRYNLKFPISDTHRIKLVLDQLKIDLILVDDLTQYTPKCFDINCMYINWTNKSRIITPFEKYYVDVIVRASQKKLSANLMNKNNFEIQTNQLIKMINCGWSLPMDDLFFREKILKTIHKMTPIELCVVIPQITSHLYKEVKNTLDANHKQLIDQKKQIMMGGYHYKPLLLSPCCLPDYLDIAYLFLNILPIDETLGIKIYSLAPEKINNATWFQLSKILIERDQYDLINKYKIFDKITNDDAAKLVEILIEKNCCDLLIYLIDHYGVQFIKDYSNLDNLMEKAKLTESHEMIEIIQSINHMVKYSGSSDNYNFLNIDDIAQV